MNFFEHFKLNRFDFYSTFKNNTYCHDTCKIPKQLLTKEFKYNYIINHKNHFSLECKCIHSKFDNIKIIFESDDDDIIFVHNNFVKNNSNTDILDNALIEYITENMSKIQYINKDYINTADHIYNIYNKLSIFK